MEDQTMSDKLDQVKNIIAEQLGVSEDEISEDSNLVEDLDADSLDIVELVMAFEDEFGVKVPDDQLENIKTVGDIIKILDA
jgi:acyl carrier protein